MECLYVISISLQMAGALLLMVNSLSSKREDAIKKFFNHTITELDGNTNEVKYNEEEFKDTFKQIYLTIFSFIYICFGYILGIFGNIENANKLCVLVKIILLTVCLIIIAHCLAKVIVAISSRRNKTITKEELDKLGINTDIKSMSKKDIYDVIEKVETNIVDEN